MKPSIELLKIMKKALTNWGRKIIIKLNW